MMQRRDFLLKASVAGLTLAGFPFGWTAASEKEKFKVLYFTRSAGYEHSMVRRKGNQLSFSEQLLTDLGAKHGFDVVCTKDGRVFDKSLDEFDVIAFYTSGDLCKPNRRGTPPMSQDGKKRLLDAVAAGKGFVAFHAASDSFHSPGPRNENQSPSEIDPYIAMLGGEFITHGRQQKATIRVVDQKFPGAEKLGESFQMLEEWYALKNFAPDLHVILVQETKGMVGPMYERPPYPETWARLHHKGRVFYTSMGHRQDVWTSPIFQSIVLGGLAWAAGRVDADVTPNIQKVTPEASKLGKPKKKKKR